MGKITVRDRIRVRERFKNKMRELWSLSKYREQALNNVKKKIRVGTFKNGNPKYEYHYSCEICGNLYQKTEMEVDHIKELARVLWNKPFDEDMEELVPWLQSLFCDSSNLQALCIKCHSKKTAKYAMYLQLGGDKI